MTPARPARPGDRLRAPARAWAAAAALLPSAAALALPADRLTRCAADAACLARLEPDALRAAGGAVRREGAALTLRFGPHPEARFVDQPPLRHHYLGRLDGLALHLVRGEGAGATPAWWLVSEAGQAPLRVDAPPVPGPGGRHFVVALGHTLTLYQRAGERWSRHYRFEAPEGLRWEVRGWRADEAAVRLAWHWPQAPQACPGQPANGLLQLRDGPYGWDLVPQAPRHCAH